MTPNQPPTPEKSMTFTNQIPTVLGFYAWKADEGDHVKLLQLQQWNTVIEVFHGSNLIGITTKFGGLWCLLLPSDEIEKAFREGYYAGDTKVYNEWLSSRAYKIAKGEEV